MPEGQPPSLVEHRIQPRQVLLDFGQELVREISAFYHTEMGHVPLSVGLEDKPQLVELLFAANLPHIVSHSDVPMPPSDASAKAIVQHHLQSHDGYRLDSLVSDFSGISGAQLLLQRPGRGTIYESVQVQVAALQGQVTFRRAIPKIGVETVILSEVDDLIEMRREKRKVDERVRETARWGEAQSGSFPLHIQYLLEGKGLQVESFPPLTVDPHDKEFYRKIFEYLDHATKIKS